ncbi:hypothetical protein niasHT_019758 [Heterodera trifolii]|uniref:ETS domain-containing protein n=1 Tax=Heterodera trifolii TaxID=157864 RepID=A0ABD2LC43_9BILA
MRRLLAWGRQDPLCPAEAASPPPLSAFYSPSSLLPPSSKLFSDIERQLSARIAAEPLLRSAQPQPSPPTERTSPLEPTRIHSAAANGTAHQRVATADFEQQQQQSAVTNGSNVHQSQEQPKGIDAFFAALANASRDSGGAASSSAASSVSYQQQQQSQMAFLDSEYSNPRRNTFPQHSSIVARMSSDLCSPLISQQQQQQFVAQPLAHNVQQQVTNTELAANLLVNAIAAQQQQQNQMRPSMELLANLNTTNQSTASVHQPLPQFNSPLADSQSSSSIDGSAALNAFQLVQQTAQLNNQKMLVEQQQHQLISAATMAIKSPLSPKSAVFAGSQVGIPALLNQLSAVPSIFHSIGPSHSKPIPLLDERMDLLQFKRKEPREWSSDDVVAWILDVARRHQIPCENLNLAKFANCTGPLLMLMNEQSFKENDPNFGSLLFSEFCKLITDENFIDEWMKVNGAPVAGTSSASDRPLLAQIGLKKPAVPSHLLQQTALLGQLALQQEKKQRLLLTESVVGVEQQMRVGASATITAGTSPTNILINAVVAAANSQQQHNAVASGGCAALSSLNQLLLPPPPAAAAEGILQQPMEKPQLSPVVPLQAPPLIGQSAIASLSRMIQPIHGQQHITSATSGTETALIGQQQRAQQHILKPNAGEGMKRGVGRPAGSKNKVEKQIKRNKDGRPRKRSQHTKGNKLWEFIRDALKDPRTCPSVVRWEDPTEGVFRIVESERLAFLWGQKKNNQKMTYEKLSRAMRTYYEKQILVPVPKSGLYPKKLVYKFGPTAHGWRTAASLAVQSHLALIGAQGISM